MKLDKEDIVTAKNVAKTLQQSKNDELVVVGNLLAHLLTERDAPQRTAAVGEDTRRAWVGLTNEEELQLAGMTDKSRHWLVAAVEAKLKEKNQ